MRVHLFEHVCGGGMGANAIPATLAAQGGAMLAAIACDLGAAGIEAIVMLDRGAADTPVGDGTPSGRTLPLRSALRAGGARVHFLEPDADVATCFDRHATGSDATLVIAPESGGLLEHWAGRLARDGIRSLGCGPAAIALCADKLHLAAHLSAADVPAVPAVPWAGEIPGTLPVVVKPRRGAGCEDTWLCPCPEALPRADMDPAAWIVQPYAAGAPASVSLIVDDDAIRPLAAGAQIIAAEPREPRRLRYHGGRIPLADEPARRAVRLATRAVATLPDPRGFVGVDLVLGDGPDADRVIEINARLTMSYVGLRALCTTNLGATMLDPTAPVGWRDATVHFDAAGRLGMDDAS